MRILIFVMLIIGAFFQQPESKLTVAGEINYEFKSMNTYNSFDANDSYVIWFEYTQGILFVYDLAAEEVEQMKLARGRGPSEFQMISDMYISDENVIYLADYPNSKLLVWDVKESAFRDDMPLQRPPFRIIGTDSMAYVQSTHMEQPLLRLNLDSGEQHTLDIGNGFYNEIKGMERMFSREGELVLDGEELFHLSKYKTAVTRFTSGNNAEEPVEIQTVAFVEPQDLGLREANGANGTTNFRLNPETLLLAKDMVKRPTDSGFYVIMEDNRETLKFSNKRIYYLPESSLSKLDENNAISLPFAVEYLTANSTSLFAYSKADGKMYILE